MTAVVLPEYQFGAFRLLRDQRQLLANGDAVKLGARAFDVLLALVERSDRVVPKHELMELIWPRLVVEENNLQVQMVALRKLLGPGAIATVPGRGYRFTLEMQTPGAVAPVGAATHANAPDVDRSMTPQPERTNLPRRLPVLFGRGADVARVRGLLADYAVVTIAGAGGIGKTRLAQAVANDILREVPASFADGVWMVELAALSDGELVAGAVARVLGVAQLADHGLVDALIAALRKQSLLLVLDNCEHLLQAVAGLVEAISQGALAVRILVTSQEPLKTTEEYLFRLDTLAVPAADGATDATLSGAVQLFVERARAADPRFAMTPDNAAAVADICRRLDGIPLALELAAARVALLGVEGLRARLDERLQILTGGSRFVLRRHQTLRAALEFSHGLLSVEERVVFRRLGVFAGSFALEVAQEVAADDAIDTWAVLDHLGTLVDKSMVVAEGDKLPRLRLLETTRAYALEKLADAEETIAILERHAHATARLFARMLDEFWNWSDEELIARYEPELNNLRAALAWGLRNEPEAAIALTGDARPLWVHLALQPEGRICCEAALARVSAATPQRTAGRLWHAVAVMLVNALPAQSRDASKRAIDLLRHADDPGTLAAAMAAAVSWSRATPEQPALGAMEELRRMSSPRWPPRMRMMLPNASAKIHRTAGRYSEARRDYELSRDLAVSCGATQWALGADNNIADIALIMGDVDLAIAIYREIARRIGPGRDKLYYGYSHGSMTTALLFKSETAAARETLAEAAPLIVRYDIGARYAATAALLAAQEKRAMAAARLLGYRDAATVAHGLVAHEPTEIQARNLVLQWLRSVATAGEIEQWMQEGAQFSSEEAYGLALAREELRDSARLR